VLSARLPESKAEVRIEELLAPFRARGLPYGWVVGPGARPRNLRDRLTRHGLPYLFDLRGMAAELTRLALEVPGPAGLAVEAVRDEPALREWVGVLGKAFGDPPEESASLLRLESDLGVAESEPRTLLLGLLNGVPVATACLFVDGESAGIYNVGTLPEHRGRGIGAAMTRAALQIADDQDYPIATLLSTAQGLSLYRELGFEAVGVFAIHGAVPPAAKAAAPSKPVRGEKRSSRTARPSGGARAPRGNRKAARRSR